MADIRKQKTNSTIPDYSGALILTRRLTVIAIIFMGWLYQHSLAENIALTEIGLTAFALAVQLAPAIFGGKGRAIHSRISGPYVVFGRGGL